MSTELTRRQTPEERELESKRAHLAALETTLTQRELDLATLKAELQTFEARYLREVGTLYAELDGVEAEIAEILARMKPKDHNAQEHAARARTQAHDSAQAAGAAQKVFQQQKFSASDSLKKLYRDVAKSIHPDLATEDADRARRQHFMAEANEAYTEGNEAKLQAILRDWDSSPEAVKGEGIAAELIRVIRKIAQVEERLRTIETEMAELKESDLHQMKVRVEEAEGSGQELLTELVSHIKQQIAEAKKQLVVVSKRKTNG